MITVWYYERFDRIFISDSCLGNTLSKLFEEVGYIYIGEL